MINYSPYDSVLAVTINVDSLNKKLLSMLSEKDTDSSGISTTADVGSYVLVGHQDNEQDVPMFTHPVVVEYKNRKYVISDARMYVKRNEAPVDDISKLITNAREFTFMKERHIVTTKWVENTDKFFNMSPWGRDVFIRLVTGALSFNYSLEMDAVFKTRIVLFLYWRSMFTRTVTTEYHELGLYQIAKDLPIDVQSVMAFGRSLKMNIDSLDDLVDNLKKCSGVLDKISASVLIGLVSKGWMGVDAAGIIAASLVHPPTWISVLNRATTNTSYKNTLITKSAQSVRKPKLEKAWKLEYKELADVV